MKKLRLLLTEDCDRNCEGCCNQDWDLTSLPVADTTEFALYSEILLTGGEPMLYPNTVIGVSDLIHFVAPKTEVYVYTAKVDDIAASLLVLQAADGLTVTLHDDTDIQPFKAFDSSLYSVNLNAKSLRLNVFKGVTLDISQFDFMLWEIKDNMEWIKKCPLPKNEIFKRLI
jgi:organic radical activating enzyme